MFFALQGNGLVVGFYNFLYNGKSETGSCLVFASGSICFIESFKDVLLMVVADALSIVLYGDFNLVVIQYQQSDENGRAGVGEL